MLLNEYHKSPILEKAKASSLCYLNIVATRNKIVLIVNYSYEKKINCAL